MVLVDLHSLAPQLRVCVNTQVLTGLTLAGLGAGLVLWCLCRRSKTGTPGS